MFLDADNIRAYQGAVILTIWLSLAVASITMTLSRAKVFKGFRQAVKRNSLWLGDLLDCPYCLSHWVALFMVAFCPIKIILVYEYTVFGLHLFDFLFITFVVVTLSSFWQGLIWRAYRGLTPNE